MSLNNTTLVMIDGAYVDKVLEHSFGGARIDFEKLVNSLVPEDQLLRTYYYHCPPYMSYPPTEEQLTRSENKSRFFSALETIPKFEVRLGKLVYKCESSNGQPIFAQKLIDTMMSVDIVKLAMSGRVNKVVVVAGDSDYVPAITAVKELGVLTTVVFGPSTDERDNIHTDLWNVCDERIQIDNEMINEIER